MLRRGLVASLIAFALLIERFAWYGVRTVAYLDFSSRFAMATSEIGNFFSIVGVVAMIAPFVGAAFCAGIRARWVAVAGAGMTALAFVLVSIADDKMTTLVAFAGVTAVSALFRTAILVAAGEVFERNEARLGFFFLLYALVNAGAAVGSSVAPTASSLVGTRGLYAAAAGIVGVVALVCGVAAVLPLLLPGDDEPAPQEPPRARGIAPWIATVAVVLVVAPFFGASGLVDTLFVDPAISASAAHEIAFRVFMINPLVIVAVCPLLAAAFAALSLGRFRIPLAAPLALGLAAGGIGTLAAAALPTTVALAGLVTAIVALGEALAAPAILARVAAGLPWRAQGFAVALWLAASYGAGMIPGLLASLPDRFPGFHLDRVLLASAGILALTAGVVIAAAFRPLDRAFSGESPVTPDVATAS